MAEFIRMPALSPTMTQGYLVRWHKNPEDEIKPGDLLMDVETDKAMMEVESTQGGILDVVLAFTEAVQVGQVIGVLRKKTEAQGIGHELLKESTVNPQNHESKDTRSSDIGSPEKPSQEQKKEHHLKELQNNLKNDSQDISSQKLQKNPEKSKEPQPLLWNFSEDLEDDILWIQDIQLQQHSTHEEKNNPPESSPLKVSPYGKKWAKDHDFDLNTLSTTCQKEPRLKQKDIEELYKNQQNTLATTHSSSLNSKDFHEKIYNTPGENPQEKTLSSMQRVIAQRLTESKTTIPHFYLSLFCPMDNLLNFRQDLNRQQNKRKFSITDFVVKACALSIMENPEFLKSWKNDKTFLEHSNADISLAVALKEGLITPIISQAQKLTLGDLHDCSQKIVQGARQGTLRSEEFTGGVFTISNLGMMNVDHFFPIINPPQSGILGVGSLRSQVIPKKISPEERSKTQGSILGDYTLEVVQGVTFTLGADHRVVNGDAAARFLDSLQRHLQNPHGLLF